MTDENHSRMTAASWVHAGRQPARWDGASLAAVAEINELMLERLRAAALGAGERPRLVEGLREWWCQLDDVDRCVGDRVRHPSDGRPRHRHQW